MKNHKIHKQIKNNYLPKYDIGKMPLSQGYQNNDDDVPIGSVDNPGQNLGAMANAQRQSNVITGISDSLNTATNLTSMFMPEFRAASAAERAASGVGSSVTNGGLTAAQQATGYIGGGLGMVTGGLQAAKGIYELNHALSDSDLQEWSGSSTNYGIAGRQYKAMTSPGNQAMNVVNQRLKSAGINTSLGLTSAGSGLGSTIGTAIAAGAGAGSSVPVIGTAIGAVAGLLTGLGTFFGMRKKARNKARTMLQNQTSAFSNYNRQSLAEANTLGLRDEFNASHAETIGTANNGKQPFDPTWMVQNGWAHNGEYQVDSNTGLGHEITNGTGHNEDAPVYAEPQDVIYTDKYATVMTGEPIAKVAKRASENIERGNNVEYNKRILDSLTQEQAVYRQLDHMKRNNRKKGMFKAWGGFGGTDAFNIANYLANTSMALKQHFNAKGSSVAEYNPYVNNTASLQTLDLAKPYRDYSALNQIDDQYRQSRYNLLTGPYSAGNKLMGSISLANNVMKNKAAAKIAADWQYFTNYADWAKNKSNMLEQMSTRRQQANQYADVARRQAYGAKYNEMSKFWNTQAGNNNAFAQNRLNNIWFNKTLGLYQQYLGNN